MRQQLRWTGHSRLPHGGLSTPQAYAVWWTVNRFSLSCGPTKAPQGSVKKDSGPLQPWLLSLAHFDEIWGARVWTQVAWSVKLMACPHWRRFRRQSPFLATVAEIGDYSHQCGQGLRPNDNVTKKPGPLLDLNGSSPCICHTCGRVCRARIGHISHLPLPTDRDWQSSSFLMHSNNNIHL